MDYILFGLIAYILGSIPSAVWIGKKYYGVDVREQGSKNAGATNTFRVLGKNAGIIVLLMDVIKGVLAVSTPYFVNQFLNVNWTYEYLIHIQLIAALSAIIGHVFPLFANFKGGKGVATSLGVIVALHPPTALVCFILFFIVFLVFNYVSLGAIVASISFPIVIYFVFNEDDVWLNLFSIFLGLAVIIAHKKNIKRLINKEESKMSLFKKKQPL
jgi:glycerol-3-phosphate acyltransferase PlsY